MSPSISLTPEEEAEVVKRYRDYAERMERPPEGRPKTIAKDLEVPFRLVSSAVQGWKRTQRPVEELTREQRFEIEKAYFRFWGEGKSLNEILGEIERKSGLSHWPILRFRDLIHDEKKLLKKTPEVAEEQEQSTIRRILRLPLCLCSPRSIPARAAGREVASHIQTGTQGAAHLPPESLTGYSEINFQLQFLCLFFKIFLTL